MRQSFVFLAEGFEDIEAITVIDLLRRAEIPVKTVSISSSLQVRSAHGVTITADTIFDNTLFNSPEWLILPGGMPGATNLFDFAPLQGLLRQQAESEDGRIAAICAAPAVVLGQLGLLEGKKATCYPGFEPMLKNACHIDEPVVADGKFVTASGPGMAMNWALKIIALTCGSRKAEEVACGLLVYPNRNDSIPYSFG